MNKTGSTNVLRGSILGYWGLPALAVLLFFAALVAWFTLPAEDGSLVPAPALHGTSSFETKFEPQPPGASCVFETTSEPHIAPSSSSLPKIASSPLFRSLNARRREVGDIHSPPMSFIAGRSEFDPFERLTVRADVLRIRAEASVESEHVASLRIGAQVHTLQPIEDVSGDWVEIIALMDGIPYLTQARGFVPKRFLRLRGQSDYDPDSLAAKIQAAERAYAATPSPENTNRLADLLDMDGRSEKASAIRQLAQSISKHDVAICYEGELAWVNGGPYVNDVWRGNSDNQLGLEALQRIVRSWQGATWFSGLTQKPSFQPGETISWPWQLQTRVGVDPESRGHGVGEGYRVAELDTRMACNTMVGANLLYATTPVQNQIFFEHELDPALIQEFQLGALRNRRAFTLKNAPNWIVVSGQVAPQEPARRFPEEVRDPAKTPPALTEIHLLNPSHNFTRKVAGPLRFGNQSIDRMFAWHSLVDDGVFVTFEISGRG